MDPNIVPELRIKGRELTSLYEGEREATRCAIDWTKYAEADIRQLLISTDSQSLVQTIKNNSKDTDELKNKLEEVKAKAKIQWVPNDVNISGNEMVDRIANEATMKCL